MFFLRIVAICLFGAFTAVQAETLSRQPEYTTEFAEREALTASDFMIVTANPLATRAGYDVLAAGGSAADAAVAAQMVLGLSEPQSSGLGGGAMLLYWNAATGQLTSFDGRETAPAAATPDYWLAPSGEPVPFWSAVVGGRSVGTPGTVKLMEAIHRRFGRLPWGRILAPAIELAENGFVVSPRMASSVEAAKDTGLNSFAESRAYFFDDSGDPVPAGQLLRNPGYARTLRLLADQGSAPFYSGSLARDLVAAVQERSNPGLLTLEDLAQYEVVERPPVCIGYREYEVCGMGPPSSGGITVGQILGILESSDLPGLGPGTSSNHLFLEASKLAFADRGQFIADPDHIDVPTEGLVNIDYLSTRAAEIDPENAMTKARPGNPPWDETLNRSPDTGPDRPGTTHFVIVDRYGDMLSATSTIEQGFGSRIMTNGFLLNNEMTDFSFVPEADSALVANRVEGGKRPRSSMSPTIVFRDENPAVLIGSPGGSRIIPYVALSLVEILDFGMAPQDAINNPHIVNRNSWTEVEQGPAAAAIVSDLEKLGHETRVSDLNSGLQVIVLGDEQMTGAADKRREGTAMGK